MIFQRCDHTLNSVKFDHIQPDSNLKLLYVMREKIKYHLFTIIIHKIKHS